VAVCKEEARRRISFPPREKAAWFAESGASGPAANPEARAPWAPSLIPAMAAAFAPEVFLKGPAAGV